ncbi:hypothetical protein BCV71DRAFT_168867, partial [Rhizopus microsporus]
MGGYYAVRVGRRQGIYKSWSDCKEQVLGVSGAKFKKFNSLEEAQAFVDADVYSTPRNTQSQTCQRYSPYASQRTHSRKTVVYTDGASAGNGQTGARAGYGVYWGDNDPRN